MARSSLAAITLGAAPNFMLLCNGLSPMISAARGGAIMQYGITMWSRQGAPQRSVRHA